VETGKTNVEIRIINSGLFRRVDPNEGRVWMTPCPKVKKQINPCVHALILKRVGKTHQVVLVKRKTEPFKGKFTFPGGNVNYKEVPVVSLQKLILEQTGFSCFV